MIWDREQKKRIKMTPKLLKEARDDPEKWPGCVEAGIKIIKPLFANHVCPQFTPCPQLVMQTAGWPGEMSLLQGWTTRQGSG